MDKNDLRKEIRQQKRHFSSEELTEMSLRVMERLLCHDRIKNAKTVMMYDEVESVSLMSGAYDLAVTVTGSSLKVIALFVAQRLSTIDGVLSTATHFVLKRYKEKGIFIEQEPIDERGMVSP